jgi:hypothetical protein
MRELQRLPPHRAAPLLPRELETGLKYMLAMRQLDCEIERPKLIDVAPGADIKPDILKDLLKV